MSVIDVSLHPVFFVSSGKLFHRAGFARDSEPDTLRQIKRADRKPKACFLPSDEALLENSSSETARMRRTAIYRLAPKRKALAEACSSITSILTEQDKHEDANMCSYKDSSASTGTSWKRENQHGKENNKRDYAEDDKKIEANKQGSDHAGKTETVAKGGSLEIRAASMDICNEVIPMGNMKSVDVSDEDYDNFQYSHLFKWSPIRPCGETKLIKPTTPVSASSVTSRQKSNFLSPPAGAWSQKLLSKRPGFSPITAKALDVVSSAGGMSQELPTNDNVLFTPSKEQVTTDGTIHFSWHSRAIRSVSNLPHIDADDLLRDLAENATINKMSSLTPSKDEDGKRITSALSTTTAKD